MAIAGLLIMLVAGCAPGAPLGSEALRARPCGVECEPGWCADFSRPWPAAPTPAKYVFYRCGWVQIPPR